MAGLAQGLAQGAGFAQSRACAGEGLRRAGLAQGSRKARFAQGKACAGRGLQKNTNKVALEKKAPTMNPQIWRAPPNGAKHVLATWAHFPMRCFSFIDASIISLLCGGTRFLFTLRSSEMLLFVLFARFPHSSLTLFCFALFLFSVGEPEFRSLHIEQKYCGLDSISVPLKKQYFPLSGGTRILFTPHSVKFCL
jgi:hypothetical protein